MSESVNPCIWGDQTNSCYLPMALQWEGRLVWAAAPLQDKEPFYIMQLSLCNGRLVANLSRYALGMEPGTGKTTWTVSAQGSAGFAITEDGVLTLDPDSPSEEYFSGLVVSCSDGSVHAAKLPCPGLGTTLMLVASTQNGEHFYGYRHAHPVHDGPSDGVSEVGLVRYDPRRGSVTWEKMRYARYPSMAANHDVTRYCFSDGDSVITGAIGSAEEITIPLDLNKDNWVCGISYDRRGNMVVAAEDGPNTTVSSFAAAGNRQWRVVLKGRQPESVPPVCAPDGRVYYRAGRFIYCIEGGRRCWRYDFGKPHQYPMMTAFEGGMLLVAVEKNIVQLSPQGKELRRFGVDENITCRPIADAAGRIYLGTLTKVYCIE